MAAYSALMHALPAASQGAAHATQQLSTHAGPGVHLCIALGCPRASYNGRPGEYCGRACRARHAPAAAAICALPGCQKGTWNSQPGEYCSMGHKAQAESSRPLSGGPRPSAQNRHRSTPAGPAKAKSSQRCSTSGCNCKTDGRYPTCCKQCDVSGGRCHGPTCNALNSGSSAPQTAPVSLAAASSGHSGRMAHMPQTIGALGGYGYGASRGGHPGRAPAAGPRTFTAGMPSGAGGRPQSGGRAQGSSLLWDSVTRGGRGSLQQWRH